MTLDRAIEASLRVAATRFVEFLFGGFKGKG